MQTGRLRDMVRWSRKLTAAIGERLLFRKLM